MTYMKCRCYSEKYLTCICVRSQDTQNLTEQTGSRGFTHMGCVSHSGSHQHCSCFLTSGVCRHLQHAGVLWEQMFGLLFKLNPCSDKCEENFPTAQHRPRARFWHPFPLVGNPHVREDAGNWDQVLQINHPSLGMPVGFPSSPSNDGAATAVGGSSHLPYQVTETRVPCSFCDSVHVSPAICVLVWLWLG